MFALTPWGFEIPLPVIVLGMIIGMTYGLLAVGLVLVYRTNRIINFAHGEVGAFGAALFGVAVVRWHVPYYLALPIAFAAAGGMAALAEVAVVRRLRNAPRLMSIVATLGVGQFLVAFSAAFNNQAGAGALFPSPPGLPEFTLGALRLTQAYVGMLVFGPIVVIALAVFLRRSRYGLAIRCASANQEAARMAGIFAGRMSSLAWALAGIVSAFTAILVLPSRGFTSGESFGPSLLLRALAGAVIARMNNLPAALAAGVGLGVTEQLLLWNYPRAGFVEVALFVIIVGALLIQRGVGGRDEEKGSWAAVQSWRPLPEAVARLREVRLSPWVLSLIGLAIALLLPIVVSNSSSVTLTQIIAYAIVGLSVGVITGLGGQLSLGQFAVGAIGAVVSFHVSSRIGAFPLAFLYAGLAGAAVSLLIGIPALRIKGCCSPSARLASRWSPASWLLQQSWALGDGVDPGRPIVNGAALDTGKRYYYFVLGVLVLDDVPRPQHQTGRAGPAARCGARQRGQRPRLHRPGPAREAAGLPARRVHRRHRRRVLRPHALAHRHVGLPGQGQHRRGRAHGDRRHVAARRAATWCARTSSAFPSSCRWTRPASPPRAWALSSSSFTSPAVWPRPSSRCVPATRAGSARRHDIDLAAAEASASVSRRRSRKAIGR